MFKKKQIGLAVAAISLVAAGQAMAQEQRQVESLRGENFALEEVLVTARKKVENLQSVPIAIDALSSELLIEKAVTNLEQVAKYSPGLTFQQGVLPNDTRPTIRGVNIARGRPNVGILVDGVDISSETLTVAGGGASANLSLLDLERVEVIKGPQTVTYGRSAFAGAVHYVTKRPVATDGVYGYAEVDVDEHEYAKLLGNVTVPIIENKLSMGINIATSDFDGHYDNPNTGGDLGTIEQDGFALTLNYEPGGDFSAYFRGEYAKDKYSPRALVGYSSLRNPSAEGDFFQRGQLSDLAENLPIPGGDRGRPEATKEDCANSLPYSYLVGSGNAPCITMLTGDVGSGIKESNIDQSPNPNTGKDFAGSEIENTRLMLELNWQLGDIEVLSLTGYTDNETSIAEDFDLTNFDLEKGPAGSAKFDPQYVFADPFGSPPDFTPLNNNPDAAQSQFGVNTNSDTSFDYSQFSQEFRFLGDVGNIEWMANAIYWQEDMDAVMNQQWWLRESADADYINSILSRFVDPTCTVPGNVNSCSQFTGVQTEMTPLHIPMNRDTKHWSIAGSVVYNFSDTVRATIEGRYLEETLDYESLPLDTFNNGFLNMPFYDPSTGSTVAEFQKQTVEDSAFVPRLSVDWQITDDLFTYASAGNGFKPGGISTTDGNGDISSGHYDPEELWAYEIGFKSALAGNRLRLNGAVFYNDYTDQQVPYFVVSDLGISNVSITNAGKSEITGAEIEAIYRPSQNWTFTAAWTHVEAEFKEFNISDVGKPSNYDKLQSGNIEGDFSGKSFANTPEDTGIVAIRYDGEFSRDMSYYTEIFSNYRSKQYIDQGNMAYLPDLWLVDFSAGISTENWRVTAYVNNVTDEDKIQSGLGNVSYGLFGGGGQALPFGANLSLPNPRTFGVRARYSF